MVFKNGQPYQVPHDEGRSTYNAGSWSEEFEYRDYLGDLRVGFKESGPAVAGVYPSPIVVQNEDRDPTGVLMASLGVGNALTKDYFGFINRETIAETGWIDLNNRYYIPELMRFGQVDPVTATQENYSTYQYGWNNPVLRSDPNGDCPLCPAIPLFPIVAEALATAGAYIGATSVGVVVGAVITENMDAIKVGLEKMAASGAMGEHQYASWARELNPNGSPIRMSSSSNGGSGKSMEKNKTDDNGDYNRVKPRKGTMDKVKENQPKNSKGEMIDPNTKKPLKEGEIDLGHKPGNEWKKRKEMHKEKGSSRKEVIETENDPTLYHLEDRKSNRSHKYENKN